MKSPLGLVLYREFSDGAPVEVLAERHGLTLSATVVLVEAARLCYEHQLPMLLEQECLPVLAARTLGPDLSAA